MYVMPQAAILPRVRNLQRSPRPRLLLIKPALTASRCAAPPNGRRRGVGALDPQSQQIGQIAAAGVSTAASTLVALSAITGPVGIAIAGLASIGLMIANAFSGCGQTCVEATNIANQVGALFDQMLNTYMSAPIHYKSMQTAYLQQWDAGWNALQAACSNPQLGAAGQRCISDRARGSCKWHTSPGGWQQQNGTWVYVAPGPDGSGSTCWDWFVGSRDPVANDPTVVPDPTPLSSVGSSLNSIASGIGLNSNLLLPGALVLGALALFAMGD